MACGSGGSAVNGANVRGEQRRVEYHEQPRVTRARTELASPRRRRASRVCARAHTMMGKAACFTSLALIIHATVCAVQHREYLKAVQQPFSFPPFEISIQCIAAVLLGTWGVVALQANFTPIRTTTHLAKQTVDALDSGLDFIHFNTRPIRPNRFA